MPDTPPPTPLDTVTDEQAVTALTLVLDHQHQLPDVHQIDLLDTHIRQAATQPLHHDVSETTPLEGLVDDHSIAGTGDGALARATLAYLADTRPDLAPVVEQAITLARANTEVATRFLDPVSVGVITLVTIALQTDVELERGTTGKWRFKVHKKATSDTALGQILARVIAAATRGG